MGRRAWITLIVCISFLLPGAVEHREVVRVEYVLLDVIALDGKRRPVTDLAAGDFVVTENKKKIVVETFDVTDMRLPAGDVASDAAGEVVTGATDAAAASRYIFALDMESASLPQARRTFDELAQFLEQAADPAAAYLMYSVEDGFIGDGFATDRREVLEALRRYERDYVDARTEHTRTRFGPSTQPAEELMELERRFERCLEVQGQVRNDPTLVLRCIDEELDLFIQGQVETTRRTIDRLKQLAARFESVDAINTIIFVSPGFSLHPGAAAVDLAVQYRGDLTVPQAYRLDSLRTGPSLEDEFREVLHECIGRRVVFHTFDLYGYDREGARRTSPEFPVGGPRLMSSYRRYAQELGQGLAWLAGESGGFYHSGPRLDALGGIVGRAGFIYTLGYRSPDGQPGKFRKIKVKCKRKGVKVQHRSGYYGS